MHLLQAGVDLSVIALWLGHESPATTHLYVEADLTLKRRALDKLEEPASRRQRRRLDDRLLAFLEAPLNMRSPPRPSPCGRSCSWTR